jgi:hemerythrin
MNKIIKVDVSAGISWVEIAEANIRILCGCPADSVKHLMLHGFILNKKIKGIDTETGPNAILLSDFTLHNGLTTNLSEFPVLQMLYRQGMLIPHHPNNDGTKPLLIGRNLIVKSQLAYIYRGNYGLHSVDEIIDAGIPHEKANEMLRMKKAFAFGEIKKPEELIDTLILENNQVKEIRNGVMIRRIAKSIFEISYKNEFVIVDVSLPQGKNFESPYFLERYNFKRVHFGVLHSGEGDGWDPDNPAMGGIVVYKGKVYLIDAGPNISNILSALGISLGDIAGIFQTHAHDDHCAGLSSLFQGDHPIPYYSVPLVHDSIAKKIGAIFSQSDTQMNKYFIYHQLEMDEWNDIDGLYVKPVFSPHPVETTLFYFKAKNEKDEWKSYAHFADIVSLKTLKSMINENLNEPGITSEFYEKIKLAYSEPATIKKIDIGGGLIHGSAQDFIQDQSDKIYLAHTSEKITKEQEQIGQKASFGSLDILIEGDTDYLKETARQFLTQYFTHISSQDINKLLNYDIMVFSPDTFPLKINQTLTHVYLILTGGVVVTRESKFIIIPGQKNYYYYTAGSIMGEESCYEQSLISANYKTVGYVNTLAIPVDAFRDLISKYDLIDHYLKIIKGRRFFRRCVLLSGITGNLTLTETFLAVKEVMIIKNQEITIDQNEIGLLYSGLIHRVQNDQVVETIQPCMHVSNSLFLRGDFQDSRLITQEDSKLFILPIGVLKQIPNVIIKLQTRSWR